MNQIDQQIESNTQPRKWLLILLSLFSPILGFLYLGKGRLALIYLLIFISMTILINQYAQGIILLNYVSMLVYIIGVGHAIYQGFQPSHQSWQRLHIWLKGILIFCLLWAGIRLFIVDFYGISANSMAPNYTRGNFVLMKRWGFGALNQLFDQAYDIKKLQRGDVIVFAYPMEPSISYIKRVVALPNDRISFVEGRVMINGQALLLESVSTPTSSPEYSLYKENNAGHSYLIQRDLGRVVSDYPFMQNCEKNQENHECTVPEDAVFVLGDHREESSDSRYWGYVNSTQILGKVIWSNAKQH